MGLVKRLVMSGIQHNLIGFDRTVEKLHRGSRTFLCYAQNQGLFKEDRGCIAWLESCSNPQRSQEARQAARNELVKRGQTAVGKGLRVPSVRVQELCNNELVSARRPRIGQNLPILLIYPSKLAWI
jgi:hypothetical protein